MYVRGCARPLRLRVAVWRRPVRMAFGAPGDLRAVGARLAVSSEPVRTVRIGAAVRLAQTLNMTEHEALT